MTAAMARPELNQHSAGYLLAATAATGVVSYAGGALLLPQPLTASLMLLAGGAPLTIGYERYKRALGRQADLAALGSGTLERPRLIVVTILALVLLTSETFISGVLGYVLDIGVANTGGTQEQLFAALGVVSLVLATPLFLLASFFIFRRASHYLGDSPFRWLLLGIAFYIVLRAIVASITFAALRISMALDVLGIAILIVDVALLILLAWIATVFARRRHSEFLVGRFFRKLTPADQQTVTTMLREIVEPVAPDAGPPVPSTVAGSSQS